MKNRDLLPTFPQPPTRRPYSSLLVRATPRLLLRVVVVLDVTVEATIFIAAANKPQIVTVVYRNLLASADAVRRGHHHGRWRPRENRPPGGMSG
jgi:hypothetical protein